MSDALLWSAAMLLSGLLGFLLGARAIWASMHWQLRKAHRKLGLNEAAVEEHTKALVWGTRKPLGGSHGQ